MVWCHRWPACCVLHSLTLLNRTTLSTCLSSALCHPRNILMCPREWGQMFTRTLNTSVWTELHIGVMYPPTIGTAAPDGASVSKAQPGYEFDHVHPNHGSDTPCCLGMSTHGGLAPRSNHALNFWDGMPIVVCYGSFRNNGKRVDIVVFRQTDGTAKKCPPRTPTCYTSSVGKSKE